MIRIGEYQTLKIARNEPQGFYLVNEEEDEVLFPHRYITPDMKVGEDIDVFTYCDSNDMEVATTEKPFFTLGEFAYLSVTDVNHMGAFCDWGISKELFIPFRNQKMPLVAGQKAIVYLYIDQLTYRLVGTTKINKYLEHTTTETFDLGQEVDLLIYGQSDLGYKAIVNQHYSGLIYKNEARSHIAIGDQMKGYLKPVRSDGKLDISLYPIGHQSIEPIGQMILDKIKAAEGFLPFTDKSDPEVLLAEFGISKKLFKKSIGGLYRQKLIRLEKDGIYLK